MPIPLIIWAGAAAVAWLNRDKIADFFDSEDGKTVLKGAADVLEGHLEPYKKLIEECYTKHSDKRRIFLLETKNSMDSENWNKFVAYAKLFCGNNLKYTAVLVDLLYINEEED